MSEHTWTIEGAVITYPTCPSCGQETDNDGDDFYCAPCGLGWGTNAPEDVGYRLDPEEPVCGAEYPDHGDTAPDTSIGGVPHRWAHSPCLLSTGHETRHHYHRHEWIRAGGKS